MDTTFAPKVFISYSHDSEEHKNWVLKLSCDLVKHGVDVILDQWDVRLGDDLPFFMEQGLTSSNLVLCICSDNYVEKTNTNRGGSGYEKKILSADLMKDSSQNYIIPIRRNNIKGKMPTFLGEALYLNFDNDNNYYGEYSKLLARIHNEDNCIKPTLGENPFKSNTISHNISKEIDSKRILYSNYALEGKASFDYKKNNGNYVIGAGKNEFLTYWSSACMGSIHCYRDYVKRIGYNPMFTDFPSIQEINQFDFSSRCRTIREGQIVILENQHCKFAAIKVTKVFYNLTDIDHLLEFKYKIYSAID